MIFVKNSEQIKKMKLAGRVTGEAILVAREMIREGVSTYEIDEKIRHYIEKCGGRPSFLGYGGFPGSACISLNDEVIHGIPSRKRILHEGDLVKIDVGAFIGGFHGDSANTFPVGKVSREAEQLIEAARKGFELGVEAAAKEGARIGDIGAAVDGCVRSYGFSTVKKYVGHGVGQELHEEPNVPNYGTPGHGARLCRGMVIAIEPMVNAGTSNVIELPDGWTVKTADGRLSAHYEHTVALTDEGPILLTKVE
ncbi:MAG: type I methionyl aminopeptidase [Clostridia bacterium]|nr:type I methionyl aminopeptidase [Clostridia bacterium]